MSPRVGRRANDGRVDARFGRFAESSQRRWSAERRAWPDWYEHNILAIDIAWALVVLLTMGLYLLSLLVR